jgi:hypothetical protein
MLGIAWRGAWSAWSAWDTWPSWCFLDPRLSPLLDLHGPFVTVDIINLGVISSLRHSESLLEASVSFRSALEQFQKA